MLNWMTKGTKQQELKETGSKEGRTSCENENPTMRELRRNVLNKVNMSKKNEFDVLYDHRGNSLYALN